MPRTFTDARDQKVSLPQPPQRIVSLVPSTTESLFALGAGPRVVGVTRFCVHPADQLAGLVRVGGTKQVELDRIEALQPDLVLGNAEENTREIFDAVGARWPLFVAFPRTVDQALDDLLDLGRMLDLEDRAEAAVAGIRAARVAPPPVRRRAVYLIWRDPWMAVSPDTFIAALLAEAGIDIIPLGDQRYPTVTPGQLAALDPDLVLLSSEPFPFKQRHADELAELSGLPPDRLRLVDGELCSWHGTRLRAAFPYLAELVGGGPVPALSS